MKHMFFLRIILAIFFIILAIDLVITGGLVSASFFGTQPTDLRISSSHLFYLGGLICFIGGIMSFNKKNFTNFILNLLFFVSILLSILSAVAFYDESAGISIGYDSLMMGVIPFYWLLIIIGVLLVALSQLKNSKQG